MSWKRSSFGGDTRFKRREGLGGKKRGNDCGPLQSTWVYSRGATTRYSRRETLIHCAKAVLSGSLRRQDRIDCRISLGRELLVLGDWGIGSDFG